LVVAARGNDGNNVQHYPACYPEGWVMSVGSMDDSKNKSNFSSYGNGMDVLAPGGSDDPSLINDIYSTYYRSGNRYAYLRGTSMAAPHVTGLVGLLDFYNQLPAFGSNFEHVIINTTEDLLDPGYDELTGHGLIRADSALRYVGRPHSVFTCDADTYGPYIFYESDTQQWTFFGSRHLINAVYIVKQYEVRENVLFWDCPGYSVSPEDETPQIWPIDCLTSGWSGANPNGGVRWSSLVAANHYSATFSTFVYQVWTIGGQYLGWFPNHWQDVNFGYTIIKDMTPEPPQNLSVQPSVNYHPLIQWNASPSENVVAYIVYRMVHGIENNWVHLQTVPATTHQYEDTQYSTPHLGPVAQWVDDADYTVTAVNEYGDNSDMPPFVTITVVVPQYPDPTQSKPATPETPEIPLPREYALKSAYPNPFNARTLIKYELPEDSYVVLEIFNISGQKIASLLNEHKDAGYHEIVWDASDVPSGIYLYKLSAADYKCTKKLTLVR
jgi:hypothetical protein